MDLQNLANVGKLYLFKAVVPKLFLAVTQIKVAIMS